MIHALSLDPAPRGGGIHNRLGTYDLDNAMGGVGRFRASMRQVEAEAWLSGRRMFARRLVWAARRATTPTSIGRLIDATVPQGLRPARLLHSYLAVALCRIYPDLSTHIRRPLTIEERAEEGIPL
jgi:hypothetical protein